MISSFFTLKSCLRWHQAAVANDFDMLSIFQVNTKLWKQTRAYFNNKRTFMCSCSQSPVFCKVFYVRVLQSLYNIFSDFSFFFSVGQGGVGVGVPMEGTLI